MTTLVDPKQLMAEHLSTLREYAKRALVQDDPLSSVSLQGGGELGDDNRSVVGLWTAQAIPLHSRNLLVPVARKTDVNVEHGGTLQVDVFIPPLVTL